MDQRRFNPGNKAAEEAQEIGVCVVDYYEIFIPRINEAMDTDLKAIDPIRKKFSSGVERLMQTGWNRGNTLLCQQEYKTIEQFGFLKETADFLLRFSKKLNCYERSDS